MQKKTSAARWNKHTQTVHSLFFFVAMAVSSITGLFGKPTKKRLGRSYFQNPSFWHMRTHPRDEMDAADGEWRWAYGGFPNSPPSSSSSSFEHSGGTREVRKVRFYRQVWRVGDSF
jgi:hypothetical protein